MVTGDEDDRRRAVDRRADIVGAQRRDHVVGREQLVDAQRSPETAGCLGLPGSRVTSLRHDLGEILLAPTFAREHGLRLERRQRHVVGADRREVVRIELERQRLAQRHAQTRAARREHERHVDVAVLQPHPRLVERPRTVHLHVRLGDRRPRTRGFEHLHERERSAGEIVGAARAREADITPGHADGRQRLGDRRQQHQGLGLAGLLLQRRLGKRDDRDVTHHKMCSAAGQVGFARRLPARDGITQTHAARAGRRRRGGTLGFGRPHRLHAHPRAHVADRDAVHAHHHDRRVGAVEEDRGLHVVLGLLLALVLQRRDHRERGDRSPGGNLDLVGVGRLDDAERAVATRRHVDLRALGAPVADDPAARELLAEVNAQPRRLRDRVLHRGVVRHELHGVRHR